MKRCRGDTQTTVSVELLTAVLVDYQDPIGLGRCSEGGSLKLTWIFFALSLESGHFANSKWPVIAP